MEVFITYDESSAPVPFHLAASKVMIVSTALLRRDELEPHYASIRIHCVNMFVNKESSTQGDIFRIWIEIYIEGDSAMVPEWCSPVPRCKVVPDTFSYLPDAKQWAS